MSKRTYKRLNGKWAQRKRDEVRCGGALGCIMVSTTECDSAVYSRVSESLLSSMSEIMLLCVIYGLNCRPYFLSLSQILSQNS